MFVISGATGRVGSLVAQMLLDAGRPVRVVIRRREAAEAWMEKGAEVAIADLRDQSALIQALQGAQAYFAMMPFDLSVDDLDAYAEAVVSAVAGAVGAVNVPHVVMLSSGGADIPEGTGPVEGLHRMEKALAGTGAVVTALRPGHFQEKVGDVLDAARHEGVFPVFSSSADKPLPMVATRDIAAVAVQELLGGQSKSEAVDIVGPSCSERQVAAALGKALGRELQVVTIPEQGWQGALVEAGFASHIADSLVELYRADDRGDLSPRGDRSVEATTQIATTIGQLVGA